MEVKPHKNFERFQCGEVQPPMEVEPHGTTDLTEEFNFTNIRIAENEKLRYNSIMLTAIRRLIKNKPYLIWYTKNYEHLSNEAIVEAVLNYGDFDDVKKVFSILGIKRTANIFRKQINQKRKNYDQKIMNYFKLYFKKHA